MMPGEKYISVFRINGEPIIPPLMTMEKRFEMQMYREKAIQLERRFVTSRQEKRVQFCDMQCNSALMTSRCFGGDGDSEDKQSLSENSSALILTQSTCENDNSSYKMEQNIKMIDSATNTLENRDEEVKARMRKFRKSNTICFDNTTGALIRPLTDEEFTHLSEEPPQCQNVYLCQLIDESDLKNVADIKKTLYLPLQQKSNVCPKIPSIHVNPPTPLTGPSNICDTESIGSNDASGFQSAQATPNRAAEDSTDDLTENSTFSTPTNCDCNSVARELKFELMQNKPNGAPPPLDSNSDGGGNSPDLCFPTRSPQRSATSPSLKSLCDTIGPCSLTTSPRTDEAVSARTAVLRSNSFTLDGPSKVLLDHIRQKNHQKPSIKSEGSIRSNSPTRRVRSKQRSTPSPSACRDTVESKAKHVQKKSDTKSNPRTSSNVRSKAKATFNNYACNSTSARNNSLPPVKLKRSPYDVKGSTVSNNKVHGKTATSHKHQSTGKSQKAHVKKSSSSTTYTVKDTVSRTSLPNNTPYTVKTNQTCNNPDVFAEIDNRHRQKLLNLIAQQHEEQRRLQLVFEAQQRMLLEQLNNERCHQYYTDSDNLTADLHIEGCGLMTPIQQNSRNANGMYNEITSPQFQRLSPHVNLNNCYMSPCLNGMCGISGYSTTTTTTTPNNGHAIERSVQVVEMTSPVYTNTIDLNGISNNVIGSTTENGQSQLPPEGNTDTNFEKFNAAATVINAYTRGFLVRRLFQTEQIQRIVQTIRDTLIFVLNLHMETIENDEEANTGANIKLKARLLQQLTSASRTLHLIFFQTSIKERMEIISRDRKRLKTKLLSRNLKRSPRIA